MYPSFAPEDFPAAHAASQKALQTAALANSRQPDSTASLPVAPVSAIKGLEGSSRQKLGLHGRREPVM